MKLLFENWRKYALTEGITDIVFHHTPFDNLFKIIDSNRFMTSVAFAVDADKKQNKGKAYFFSTARTVTGRYNSPGFKVTTLVLDGQKLGHNFKGTPVDYWGRAFGSDTESEDRIITDKPYIDNAISYIKEVHIDMDNYTQDRKKTSWEVFPADVKKMNALSQTLKKAGIPMWIYTRDNAYKHLTKQGYTSVEEWVEEVKSTEKGVAADDWPEHESSYDRFEGLKLPGEITDALERDDYDSLSTKAKKYLYRLVNYPDDQARRLEIDIHNGRKDPEAREYIHKIVKLMRKWKIADLKEFVKTLANRIASKRNTEHNKWRGEY